MADPFSLATGVISLIVVTLQAIAGASRMIDKTIAAHRAAGEELEQLQHNLEELQRRMEVNHEKLEVFVSNTKDRGFKKLLQSNTGQAAVVRLCQALKETHDTLNRLTDQTESEEGTLRANALPSKKRSLAFVLAVLKHNVSPETIDEMIRNLREMQKEIQDRLKNLETSFNDVQNSYDFFHQQLVRVPTSSSLFSTSTTLTVRVQLASWLEKFGGRGFSERRRKGNNVLRTFFQADQDVSHISPLPRHPNILLPNSPNQSISQSLPLVPWDGSPWSPPPSSPSTVPLQQHEYAFGYGAPGSPYAEPGSSGFARPPFWPQEESQYAQTLTPWRPSPQPFTPGSSGFAGSPYGQGSPYAQPLTPGCGYPQPFTPGSSGFAGAPYGQGSPYAQPLTPGCDYAQPLTQDTESGSQSLPAMFHSPWSPPPGPTSSIPLTTSPMRPPSLLTTHNYNNRTSAFMDQRENFGRISTRPPMSPSWLHSDSPPPTASSPPRTASLTSAESLLPTDNYGKRTSLIMDQLENLGSMDDLGSMENLGNMESLGSVESLGSISTRPPMSPETHYPGTHAPAFGGMLAATLQADTRTSAYYMDRREDFGSISTRPPMGPHSDSSPPTASSPPRTAGLMSARSLPDSRENLGNISTMPYRNALGLSL